MIAKTLLALSLALLVLPVSANAEQILRSSTEFTHDPGAVPPGTKSTTVLKGYRVKNSYYQPSAPVYGEPRYAEEEVFVPVEEMATTPPAAGTPVLRETERRYVTPRQGSGGYND